MVKIGSQEKVEVADAKQKGFVSSRLSLLEESPELLDSSCREMLRYNVTLMQRIQLKEIRKLVRWTKDDILDL